jgi:hypothetical protein
MKRGDAILAFIRNVGCPGGNYGGPGSEFGELMPLQRKKRPKSTQRRQLEAVRAAANGHIVPSYPFGCMCGDVRRLVGEKDCWIASIVFTSPGWGVVGEVGLLAVEARTHRILSGTPRTEVVAAVRELKETHGDALAAAFHRARTG